ncbi:receptor expression-enhancing protein 5-like [Argiope bruennichi]|uniref:Receptor expression-enhancing protein n=1 Tax=Argiope bruennichi TaxID=94029 RepID=A0A8T0F5U1_ARGBR|nr:receptor expression-enhancing protein 5-like [Argiope bruennichi]XP_055927319.1 receptor expression-enhancing protein 5-like [Argiope bruennichi]KAF8784769.1 Receptor expression-enhancing protein 5 like protein [Argiope bruennichi]
MGRNSSFVYYILFICIGILYPAYCSLVALQTPSKKDDTLWLIYWVVFASFNILEALTDVILSWFPFYSTLKLVFLTWCSAPFTYNGAYYVYKIFLEPLFRMYGGHVDVVLTQAVETAKNVAEQIPPYPK